MLDVTALYEARLATPQNSEGCINGDTIKKIFQKVVEAVARFFHWIGELFSKMVKRDPQPPPVIIPQLISKPGEEAKNKSIALQKGTLVEDTEGNLQPQPVSLPISKPQEVDDARSIEIQEYPLKDEKLNFTDSEVVEEFEVHNADVFRIPAFNLYFSMLNNERREQLMNQISQLISTNDSITIKFICKRGSTRTEDRRYIVVQAGENHYTCTLPPLKRPDFRSSQTPAL